MANGRTGAKLQRFGSSTRNESWQELQVWRVGKSSLQPYLVFAVIATCCAHLLFREQEEYW